MKGCYKQTIFLIGKRALHFGLNSLANAGNFISKFKVATSDLIYFVLHVILKIKLQHVIKWMTCDIKKSKAIFFRFQNIEIKIN